MAAAPDKTQLPEEDYEEEPVGCFSRLLCFPRSYSLVIGERVSLLQGESRETWLKDRFRKIKEFSELVAGPKWKTFIRRFNCHNNHNSNKSRKPNFQYDPESYALNFDHGPDQEEDDQKHVFSAQFGSLSGNYTADVGRGSTGILLNR